MEKNIKIVGAKENNLKNISLELPRNKLIVFCGVSGSGKSTLAFNTIFAEGQEIYRKFVFICKAIFRTSSKTRC